MITGKDDEEHHRTLDLVLSRLAKFGFRCNPEKCSFLQDQVSYLGFIIDTNGKRPDPQRTEAITNMPNPKNVKEVEAFLGKVNYYNKFITRFSDKCKPLNRLRQKSITWNWSSDCQSAFDQLKKDISNATILAHFDPKLPVVLATDASNYGVGAVILHRYTDGSERPIAHASKTLSSAEKNYSQIEKEGLSIIYGVKKFHQYLIGRQFELVTDHQPLLSIFNPKKGIPSSSANRIQRWALCLMGYTYTIRYKSTATHANADALSRLPAGIDTSFVDPSSQQVNLIQAAVMENWIINPKKIERATKEDQLLNRVKHFTETRWPQVSMKQTPELMSYYNNRYSLSIVEGCVMKDTQVVIPPQLRQQVLRLLHRSHLGTVKMKRLARSYCWWPKIDEDILALTNSCVPCAKLQPMPKPVFKQWTEPQNVWSRIHLDFAGPFWDSKWLIMIDAKSKFPIIVDMEGDTTATNLIQVLENTFDWFGPPETVVTDNGPPFTSHQMKQFYEKYGIKHVTTPPYHPAGNGLAERCVRSFKEGMLKEKESGQNNKTIALRNFLRSYRWSPHTSTGQSPASLMFKHSINTTLDRMKPKIIGDPEVKEISESKPAKFHSGQLVWVRNHSSINRMKWKSGIILRNRGSMVYEVRLADETVMKCHQNQLRSRQSTQHSSSELESLPDLHCEQQEREENTDSSTRISTPPRTMSPPKSPMPNQHQTTPRCSRRQRRPPDRYSPS